MKNTTQIFQQNNQLLINCLAKGALVNRIQGFLQIAILRDGDHSARNNSWSREKSFFKRFLETSGFSRVFEVAN